MPRTVLDTALLVTAAGVGVRRQGDFLSHISMPRLTSLEGRVECAGRRGLLPARHGRKRENAFVRGLPAGGSARTSATVRRAAVKDILMRLGAVCAIVLAAGTTASAQIPFAKFNTDPGAANAAFPQQNAFGPSNSNYQVSYPFPGHAMPASSACPARRRPPRARR